MSIIKNLKISRICFIENRLTLVYRKNRYDNIYLGKCVNRYYIFSSRFM